MDGFGGKTFLRELTEERTGLTLAYGVYGAREPDDRLRRDFTEIKAVAT